MNEQQALQPGAVFTASAQQVGGFVATESGAVSTIVGLSMTLPDGADADWVEQRLAELCRTHEVLRSRLLRVPGFKEPVQTVDPEPALEVRVVSDGSAPAQLLDEARERVAGRAGPLVSATLVPCGGGGRRLILAVPRSVADARTLAALSAQLRDGPPTAAEEGLQYIDYAAWQDELRQGEDGAKGREFWRRLVSEAELGPPLPFVHGEPPVRQGPIAQRDISELRSALTETAGGLGVAPDRLLAFLWFGFVSRVVDAEVILGGLGVDGRSEDVAGVAGPFERVLPVPLRLNPAEPVSVHWWHFAAAMAESITWQEFLDDRSLIGLAGAPVCAATFCCRPEAPEGVEIFCEPAVAGRLSAGLKGDRLYLSAPFDAVEGEVLSLWLAQFATFAANALADFEAPLGAVSALGAAEAAYILDDLSAGPALAGGPRNLLQHLIEAQAETDAARTAVRLDDLSLSYGDLDRRANQVARALRRVGAGPDRIVGVYSGRALETVIAVLGILKAGAAYLPLDPSYPSDRLAFMIGDAGVGHVLSMDPLPDEVPLAEGAVNLPLGADSPVWQEDDGPVAATAAGQNLAYVIYTSGSTGRPKGVMVTHANAMASTLARSAFYEDPVGRFLLLSSFSFDSSVAGLFWSLSQGGTLVLPDEEIYRDPARLAGLIAKEGITHYLTLPSLHAQILEQVGVNELKCAIVAGEACPESLPQLHHRRLSATSLVNEYGPTEATVWCTGWRSDGELAEGAVPIGRPIPGAVVHILDEQLNPCATGMAGEIFVGGAGISRGYLQRPQLTAERFVPSPFPGNPGARLYRTGDLGRWRPDGAVDFLGRVDRQVKIRGHRIELGEIEAALRQIEGVGGAAVIDKESQAGKQLVAFVVPNAEAQGDGLAELCQANLRDRLPIPMVPAKVQVIEALPLTPNGKLDRNELAKRTQEDRAYVAPRSELERVIAGVWQDALGVERVGLHDNFFELGGHSLMATKLRARLQDELQIELPLKLFFEGQTVGQFAARVEEIRGGQPTGETLDRLESVFAEVDVS